MKKQDKQSSKQNKPTNNATEKRCQGIYVYTFKLNTTLQAIKTTTKNCNNNKLQKH